MEIFMKEKIAILNVSSDNKETCISGKTANYNITQRDINKFVIRKSESEQKKK